MGNTISATPSTASGSPPGCREGPDRGPCGTEHRAQGIGHRAAEGQRSRGARAGPWTMDEGRQEAAEERRGRGASGAGSGGTGAGSMTIMAMHLTQPGPISGIRSVWH